MKGDLIFRSALLEAFGEEPLVWDSRDREDVQMHNDWLDYTKLVKGAPAVDAVEVVRCKDCKHKRERNEHERNYLVEGVLICTSPDATDDCWNPVWPEHFCSCGERRADNG